ncbi:unnamed protein product [Ixodes pacificus]
MKHPIQSLQGHLDGMHQQDGPTMKVATKTILSIRGPSCGLTRVTSEKAVPLRMLHILQQANRAVCTVS